jgi:prepilin-type N-terminal cleavage/methylation domain-containing protein
MNPKNPELASRTKRGIFPQNGLKRKQSILGSAGRSNPGFTLIEVLIALTILTVGFLAVAKMQITGLMSNQYAMVLTEGTTWLQDRMEMLMGLPYDDALLAIADKNDPHVDEDPPEGYTIEWTVDDLADKGIIGAKKVTLTGQWKNRFGATQTVTLKGIKNSL